MHRSIKYPIALILTLGSFFRSTAQSSDSAAKTSHPLATQPDGIPAGSADSSALDTDADDTLSINKRSLGSLAVLKKITIRLGSSEKVPPSGFASLFQHFEVIDERPDTARIGIHADKTILIGSPPSGN